MQLTFDIPEKDILEFGKDSVQKEIQRLFKWMKIKQSFQKIAGELKHYDAAKYDEEMSKIRESAWDEYKQGLDL
ncbi:hypothetical protein JXJ21_03895 [candidate division KSB1 bacterium]|nr:hypothetical protein [candidate division KSB1 bacterium]